MNRFGDLAEAVRRRNFGMSFRQSVADLHVGRATLARYLKNPEMPRQMGAPTLLTAEEEMQLCAMAEVLSEINYPLIPEQLIGMASDYAIETNRLAAGKRLSRQWWSNYLIRHPTLSVRMADIHDRKRTDACSPDTIGKWFEKVGDLYNAKGIGVDNATCVWNLDEKGVELVSHGGKVVCAKWIKRPKKTQAGVPHHHVTILACANAEGTAMPPLIVHAAAQVNDKWAIDVPSDWRVAVTKTGYVDSITFANWFEQAFLPFIGARRPQILFMDGLLAHLSLRVLLLAKQHDVSLAILPAHSTHRTQPLDLHSFGVMQKAWNNMILRLPPIHGIITRNTFAALLVPVWKGMTKHQWAKGDTPDDAILYARYTHKHTLTSFFKRMHRLRNGRPDAVQSAARVGKDHDGRRKQEAQGQRSAAGRQRRGGARLFSR